MATTAYAISAEMTPIIGTGKARRRTVNYVNLSTVSGASGYSNSDVVAFLNSLGYALNMDVRNVQIRSTQDIGSDANDG